MLQCAAARCSLQQVAACCSVLQRVAACRSARPLSLRLILLVELSKPITLWHRKWDGGLHERGRARERAKWGEGGVRKLQYSVGRFQIRTSPMHYGKSHIDCITERDLCYAQSPTHDV